MNTGKKAELVPSAAEIIVPQDYFPGILRSIYLRYVNRKINELQPGHYSDPGRGIFASVFPGHIDATNNTSAIEVHRTAIDIVDDEMGFAPPCILAKRDVFLTNQYSYTRTYNPNRGSDNSMGLHDVLATVAMVEELQDLG